MDFEQVLCLCLRFSNSRVCLLCRVARLEVYWQYWFFGLHSKLKGLMMMWQASFDLEKQRWELTVHPSGCYTLLGKMLSIPLPETWMLSPAFPLRTIVSKYSCASAIFSCDLNFRNIYGRCAFITDHNLIITSGLAGIHIINTAAPAHFATHLSDRWRNVDMIRIMPLESFCALNPTMRFLCVVLRWALLAGERNGTTLWEPALAPAGVV